jgi:heme/copper-type cytochrome/quinol oxidase subunit 1
MRSRHFNFAQRIVFVIGLSAALFLVGCWSTSLGSHLLTGWVAYAPLSNSSIPPLVGGLHPWVRLVIWLILVVFWVAVSLVLLRSPSQEHRGTRDEI